MDSEKFAKEGMEYIIERLLKNADEAVEEWKRG